MGLNTRNGLELPTGIYHCEMMDKKNVTHYLYAGIYPENEGNHLYINSLYADTARCLYYCLSNMPTQLDVGHIINMSVKYDKITQMITCTSTGGPATEVSWFKDNEKITVTSSEDLYEYSQIITSKTSATYESRLRIVNKSSKATGTYTCEVTNSRGSRNKSLYIQGNHKIAILFLVYLN